MANRVLGCSPGSAVPLDISAWEGRQHKVLSAKLRGAQRCGSQRLGDFKNPAEDWGRLVLPSATPVIGSKAVLGPDCEGRQNNPDFTMSASPLHSFVLVRAGSR